MGIAYKGMAASLFRALYLSGLLDSEPVFTAAIKDHNSLELITSYRSVLQIVYENMCKDILQTPVDVVTLKSAKHIVDHFHKSFILLCDSVIATATTDARVDLKTFTKNLKTAQSEFRVLCSEWAAIPVPFRELIVK